MVMLKTGDIFVNYKYFCFVIISNFLQKKKNSFSPYFDDDHLARMPALGPFGDNTVQDLTDDVLMMAVISI